MKKLRLLSIFLCILAVAACDTVDFGDINQDDDAPQEASVEGLMAGAMNSFFTYAGRSYHINPTLYMQYQAQSVYTTEMRYGQNPYPWSGYYSGVLSNLKEIYDVTTADKVSATVESFGAPENQAAIAEIMSAVVWKRITDTWGPVPYTEALNADENKTPAYTDQKTIYTDLISRVKAARDMISSGDGPTGDVLYGGDMDKWQKFANSLLLSMTLQLSETSEASFAQQEFNEALAHSTGVIEEVADEAWYDYQNAPGAVNPFSRLRGSDYYLAEPFTDALNGKTPNDSSIVYSNSVIDSRIYVFSSDTLVDGEGETPTGATFGTDNGGLSGPSISDAIWNAKADLPYMTAAYTYLNRAEAAQLGWTTEDVDAMLTAGIEASYASIEQNWDDGASSSGALQSDGSAYATQRILDANDPAYSYEQIIGEEKWVALFPMGFDAWSEWRRTGYPGLKPAPDATNGGVIPKRYIYPSAEAGVNTQSYEAGVKMLAPAEDSNISSVWWDQ